MRQTLIAIAATILTLTACAHRQVTEEMPPPKAESAPVPKPKVKIKYVYVETPSTESAMTIEPYEPAQKPTASIAEEAIKLFWPLLTMIATGAVLIAVLFVEHKILNKQLARRAQLKSQSA